MNSINISKDRLMKCFEYWAINNNICLDFTVKFFLSEGFSKDDINEILQLGRGEISESIKRINSGEVSYE